MARRFLCCLAIYVAGVQLARAEPIPTIDFSVEYYPVQGMSTDEINRSIFSNSPISISGQKYGAVTRNDFSTGFDRISTPQGGCEVRNVRVRLTSRVMLPQLVNSGQSPQVIHEWNRYIGALIAHEKLHANNAKLTADTLVARLFGLRGHLPCDKMAVSLNTAIDVLVARMGDWDKKLDHETKHGSSQGAFLRGGIR